MSVFKVSTPTKTQVVNSVERVVGVFLVTTFGAWLALPDNLRFSKTALIGVGFAGVTAVYQAVKSLITTI